MFEKVKIFVGEHKKAVITAGMVILGAVVGLVIVAAAMEQEKNGEYFNPPYSDPYAEDTVPEEGVAQVLEGVV